MELSWKTHILDLKYYKHANPGWRHCQVGSLAGAAHLLKDNAGVLRGAHEEQKSSVEQKGKSFLDFDFQCEYKPWKCGLSILCDLWI